MNYWDLIENIGIPKEDLIILITLLSCIIFMAKEVRIGIIIAFLLSACIFVVFYSLGWQYFHALVVFFIMLVILILSLFISYERTSRVV